MYVVLLLIFYQIEEHYQFSWMGAHAHQFNLGCLDATQGMGLLLDKLLFNSLNCLNENDGFQEHYVTCWLGFLADVTY